MDNFLYHFLMEVPNFPHAMFLHQEIASLIRRLRLLTTMSPFLIFTDDDGNLRLHPTILLQGGPQKTVLHGMMGPI